MSKPLRNPPLTLRFMNPTEEQKKFCYQADAITWRDLFSECDGLRAELELWKKTAANPAGPPKGAGSTPTVNKHEEFKKAYDSVPSQDNEGYVPERGSFKTGFLMCWDLLYPRIERLEAGITLPPPELLKSMNQALDQLWTLRSQLKAFEQASLPLTREEE